ncbi:MAG: GNAT family protein [Meiothermus sp.]|nr:GNAT family protein [Meiothermus sp.]
MLAHRLDGDSELRLLQTHQAEALYALADRNRAHLREWLSWVDNAQDASFLRNFIRGRLEALARGQGFNLSVWHKGQVAGLVGLYDINGFKAEVGYWLGREFGGLGLMTRSVEALLGYAFGELELRRVQIKAHVDNGRSRAIPERLGFRLEGVLVSDDQLHGKPCDNALYALARQQWLELRRS